MAAPTAHEQYMIELINRARLNPEAEATRYGIDLNSGLPTGTISSEAKQPLAPNQVLTDAARDHSEWMLATDIFSHTGAGGSSPGARMASAGYAFNGSWAWGENIAWQGTTGTPNTTAYIEDQHEALFRSAGHRQNTFNETYREIGLGIATGDFAGYNTVMTTQDFAKSGSSLFVTGVAYNDGDNDDFYSPGEGQGGVGVTVAGPGGGSASTMSAGGYGIAVGPGDYVVTFSGSGIPNAVSAEVALTNQNIKLDLVDGDTVQSSTDIKAGANLRNITLLGIADLAATGNALDNKIIGNDGANVITGGEGSDTLDGGIGNDRYIVSGAWGSDTVNDTRGANVVTFEGVASSDLTGAQVGQDLVVSRIGGDDRITIGGYFDDTDNGADLGWTFVADDGAFDPMSLAPPPPVVEPPVEEPPVEDPPVEEPPVEEPPAEEPPAEEPLQEEDPAPENPPVAGPTEGDDTLLGTSAKDLLDGLGGNDILYGLGGNDTLIGGAGDDTLLGGAGKDFLDGNSGEDWASYADADQRVKVDLKSPNKNSWGAKGDDFDSIENLLGSDFNDILKGDNSDNILRGGDGNDKLYGRRGDDMLFGEDGDDYLKGSRGNDTLSGGDGDDTLKGGGGQDTFIVDSTEGVDTIQDFRASGSNHDILDLGDLLAGYDGAGPIDDYMRFTSSGGSTHVQVDLSGSGANFQTVAILSGVGGLDEQNAIDAGLIVL